ncbi:MAG: TonB-dependent receptor [bacterium]
MSNLLKIFLFGFILFSSVKIFSQVEEDSTAILVDSLLNISIRTPDYIESASKYIQTKSETPVSSAIVTSEEIERYGYKSLPELLNSLRDIYISNDLNYTFLGIRGFGRPSSYVDRIQLLVDGHCMNEIIYNSVPLDFFGMELSLIDKIEVIYGPGSSLYGANAVLGTINIITKKNSGSKYINGTARCGSSGEKRIALSVNAEPIDGFGFVLDGTYGINDGRDFYFNEFDDESTNYGIASNLDRAKYYGIHAVISAGNFKFAGLMTFWDKDIPTAPWGTDFNSRTNTFDSWRFIEASYNEDFSFDKNFQARIYYDQYKYNGMYPYDEELQWDKNFADDLGGEIKFLWDITDNYRFTSGIEIKYALNANYKYWDANETFSEFDKPFNLLSFFIQNDFGLSSQLNISLGARLDHYNDIETTISPRIGLVYTPLEDHIFKFLLGQAYRTPSVYERFYEDPVDGFKTNENLKSETVRSFEASWDYVLNPEIDIIFYGFHEEMNNLINVENDPVDSLDFYNNKDKVSSKGLGIEIKAGWEIYGGYIRYSYQKATDNYGARLPNSPQNLLKIGGYYQLFSGLNIAFEHISESPRITNYGGQLPSLNLANLNLRYKKEGSDIEVSLHIKNLFNSTIKHPASFELIQEYILQPGRAFTLSVGYGL